MSTEHLCANCSRSFIRFNTLQKLCALCAYNRNAKPRKPMKRIGKVGKEWIKARNKWIKDNPPNYKGEWACYLQISPDCLKTVSIDQLNVEHMESRTRRPDLRTDQTNLRPACSFCNELKGSKSFTEVTT